jgi:hypothetical protein
MQTKAEKKEGKQDFIQVKKDTDQSIYHLENSVFDLNKTIQKSFYSLPNRARCVILRQKLQCSKSEF